jgi:hypothetical protein
VRCFGEARRRFHTPFATRAGDLRQSIAGRRNGSFASWRAPSIRRFIRASRIVERRIDVDDERQLMIALIEKYNF